MLSIPRLSVAEARILIAGASAKATEIGVPMCIAVTDESGTLIAFERMDGGKTASVAIAQAKARTAAASRRATHEINAASGPGTLAFGIHEYLCTVGGGLPVVVNGAVVGAIGLSTGTAQQDMDCAQAGIDRLMASLK
ncbi:MAG: heme-binding protein [Rhodospirillales bacterium]|nr:heme-binding protein [Rhodospirillales bacterium]